MDALQSLANVAQIIAAVALIPIGIEAARRRRDAALLDQVIKKVQNLDRSTGKTQLKIERSDPLLRGALLGFREGVLQAYWDRLVLVVSIAKSTDSIPSSPKL